MIDDQVRGDFDRARNKALFNELVSAVGRRENRLMPFHELRNRLVPEGESYRGLQEVPVSKIVGSMDRFQDFDRAFLPNGMWNTLITTTGGIITGQTSVDSAVKQIEADFTTLYGHQ